MSLETLSESNTGAVPFAPSYESGWPSSGATPPAFYSRPAEALIQDGLAGGRARLSFDRSEPQRPVPGAVDVLALSDRLAKCEDLTSLLREAVHLLRTEIGLERAAIYLHSPDGQGMLGSFGTGLRGECTDERHVCYQKGSQVVWAHQQAESGRARWTLFPDAPHVAHVEGDPVVFGRGWLAVTPIRVGSVPVGVVYNDCAFSRRECDVERQRKAVLFCALLGHLIQAKQAKSYAFRPEATFERFPASIQQAAPAAEVESASNADELEYSTDNVIVTRALACLRREPQLTGAALSKQFGLSDGHLARLFKSETGVSMVEHRNRLRLRRFLELARVRGVNLSEAATDAGFGSYAQFHRVFRATFGSTPREYLAERQRCN